MFEIVILALALSMDAFAVSIGLGSKNTQKTASLAMACGLYFGFFQGLMPLIGYWLDRGLCAMGSIFSFAINWRKNDIRVVIKRHRRRHS